MSPITVIFNIVDTGTPHTTPVYKLHVWMSTQLTYIASYLSRSREFEDTRFCEVPDFLELQTSCGAVECPVSTRDKASRPVGLREFQGILQRALPGVVQNPHCQILLVHTNVAHTEVGKHGFRGL